MIYPEHLKPKTSEEEKHKQRRFWDYNLNPITGAVTSKNIQAIYLVDITAKIAESKKPAFRLAI